ncbi:tetratricopeptide repeat protein 27 isoform X2 [Sitodiplosis mosellana]|nr:tetratricopeptide repeat protein 27 isoform X2 [Sitodiplosis mosellana]
MSDGEEINTNAKHPELLAVSKYILTHLHSNLESVNDPIEKFICEHWLLRYYGVHQLVIDEFTDTLFNGINNVSDALVEHLNEIENIDNDSKVICLLEITAWQLHYKRIFTAKEKLQMAQQLLDVNISIEGKLGVRTKYQQKPLPQLMLRVDSPNGDVVDLPSIESPVASVTLPAILQLDDDVRLEKIQFVNEEDNVITRTKGIVQALILGTYNYIQKSQPKDKLANEELMPYLTTLMYQEQGPWPIRISVLLENISMEATHKRTVERSLKQCEEIMKLVTKSDATSNFHRLSFVYASYVRPHWLIRAQLADLMVSLGFVKTALDIYLEIERWEAVIMCYNMLDLKHKAAEVIQNELKKKESVELYCMLGDALDDKTWYERAWEFSKERSGRAQRHLGTHYYAKKQFEEAIPHLEKSIAINSLQEAVWSRLGYAALSLERWELAAKAYRHYTHIEPNGFESWNNLAKAYLNLGDKQRAHKILTEALRCNYDNWKVWENFLIVSLDTGNFEDVLNAHHRLGELKSKHLDKEVLMITVNAICNNTPDAQGRPSERLLKKAQNLLAQLCVQYPTEGGVFELSAKLLDKVPLQKAQKLQKAYRAYTQGQNTWTKTPETTIQVLSLCNNLCESSLRAYDEIDSGSNTAAASQLSSARLTTQGCIKAAKDSEWQDQCSEQITTLTDLLDTIKTKLLNKA